jgi:hypothetical protein
MEDEYFVVENDQYKLLAVYGKIIHAQHLYNYTPVHCSCSG